MKKLIVLYIILIPLNLFSQSAQWRGPERNGIYPDTALMKIWPEAGPELLLKVSGIGEGFSSGVESDGIIYITGKKDSLDYLSAINEDGQILWQVPYGKAWNKTYADSRCTPTVEENRVYVISGTGKLSCLDAKTGKKNWAIDVDKVYESDYHLFGLAESPLIVDDLVISTPGGKKTTMVAFNKYSGELVWQSQSIESRRSYASPVLFEYKDIRLILGFTSKDLIGVNPESGEIVWTYPYYLHSVETGVEEIGINLTNTPIFKDNEIFITSGYDCPSVMLTLSEEGNSVTEKWINPTLDNHHHGVVLFEGHIYGSNFYNNRYGKWVCLNWDTGEVMYLTDWKNKGTLILADGMLYIYEEKSGFVGLAKPDPDQFEVVSSFQIREGKGPHWSHPSVYNGKLFIRHGDVLMVYDIKAAN
ncbi:PQQ-binding-like beta-propeller repeat protein [Bacteroidota bacterium]